MKYLFLKKPNIADGLIYFLLLTLVIILRCLVLTNFSFNYTDSDQTIMWLGLKDYSKGLFYEPRFYGQSYNSMMEAFFAVPLYKLGLPAYKALPIITSFLALIPYIIISGFTYFKKSKKTALVILSIPLLLSPEYSFITSLSRGFVTGVFISAFGCIGVFFPKSNKSFFWCGFLAVLAYIVNSNSVLLSVGYLLFLFLENIKNKQFYFFSFLGIFFGIIIQFSVAYFYTLNPYYDLHRMQLLFSFTAIIEAFYKLDIFFNNVTPIFWSTGFLGLVMFLSMSFFFYIKKEYIKAGTIMTVLIFIIFTLGINKVHDGTNSVFFSYSRMYLAIPVLLALFLSFFEKTTTNLIYLYLFLPLACFIYQINILGDKIETNTSPTKNHIVCLMEPGKVINECNSLKKICTDYNIQLVVMSSHWNYDLYNYACPSCADDFPNTLNPSYERRTWRLLEDEQKTYKNILLIDIRPGFASQFNFVKKIKGAEFFYMIENNTMPTMNLLQKLGIPIRKYK